jgi:hypothetical protein
VATGGITRGRATKVSTNDFPGHFVRASNQAKPIPNGRMISVLKPAVPRVKPMICASSAFIALQDLASLAMKP